VAGNVKRVASAVGAEILDRVDDFLTGLEKSERQEREERTEDEAAKPLTLKQVAVSLAT
jgi:hypothetical protein